MQIRRSVIAVACVLMATALGGCVVEAPPAPAPARYVAEGYAGPPVYAPPPGVVYVRPAYARPAPGYIWRYHRHFGWGWWHPNYGWHRGWAAY